MIKPVRVRRTNPKGGYYDDQYRTAFVGIAPSNYVCGRHVVEDPVCWTNLGFSLQHPVFRSAMKEAFTFVQCAVWQAAIGKETTAASIESVNDL